MATAREMANAVFMWDDAVTEISGVTIAGHSTEHAGYEAENLLKPNRHTVFMTTATGDNVNVGFNLQSSQAILGLSIHNHNMNTKDVSNFTIRYGNASFGSASVYVGWVVATVIGDDDFFYKFQSALNTQYVWLEFDSIDAVDLYVGRVGLWRSAYQLETGLGLGSSKGYSHIEDILPTKSGVEHAISRGSIRRRFNAAVNYASTTERTNITNLIEHVGLNHKAFCTSWPFGTTLLTGTNIYGAAVHAKIPVSDWEYMMHVASRTSWMLPIREDL